MSIDDCPLIYNTLFKSIYLFGCPETVTLIKLNHLSQLSVRIKIPLCKR